MSARAIDLSCDLGEDAGAPARDLDLLRLVTSASVACGGHAGDEASMTAIVRAAAGLGVAVGAHPSYPDRAAFGRASLPMPPAAIEAAVAAQAAALAGVCRAHGVGLSFVKPHGALYHDAMRSPAIARAVALGTLHLSAPAPALVGLAGPAGRGALAAWASMGLRVIAEAFADRLYLPDGSLAPREQAGAVIDDPAAAAAQAVRIAQGAGAVASDGTVVALAAHTICVHADTPGSVEVARRVREGLEAAGVAIRAVGRDAPSTGR